MRCKEVPSTNMTLRKKLIALAVPGVLAAIAVPVAVAHAQSSTPARIMAPVIHASTATEPADPAETPETATAVEPADTNASSGHSDEKLGSSVESNADRQFKTEPTTASETVEPNEPALLGGGYADKNLQADTQQEGIH